MCSVQLWVLSRTGTTRRSCARSTSSSRYRTTNGRSRTPSAHGRSRSAQVQMMVSWRGQRAQPHPLAHILSHTRFPHPEPARSSAPSSCFDLRIARGAQIEARHGSGRLSIDNRRLHRNLRMSIGAIDLVEPYVIFSAPRGTCRSLPSARLTSTLAIAPLQRCLPLRLPLSALRTFTPVRTRPTAARGYEPLSRGGATRQQGSRHCTAAYRFGSLQLERQHDGTHCKRDYVSALPSPDRRHLACSTGCNRPQTKRRTLSHLAEAALSELIEFRWDVGGAVHVDATSVRA